jgi:long-chain fatty acid transport protein
VARILIGVTAVTGGLLTLALDAAPAQASGFLVARFGGEQGHPTTDDVTALYYNPAGLALGRGTRLYANGVLAYRIVDYQRPSGAIDNPGTGTPNLAANSGRASMTSLLVGPFLGVTSDFGIPGFGVGLAYYVPFGAQSSWPQNHGFTGRADAPGAIDGIQRWSDINGVLRSHYFSLGLGYTIGGTGLSVGATGSVVYNQVRQDRARNFDGTDDVQFGPGVGKEGRSLVDVTNVTGAIGVGLIYQPWRDLWMGVSYQSQPGFGETRLSGTLTTKFGVAPQMVFPVDLVQSLPDVVWAGIRFRPVPRWELRVFGSYERWSVFNHQCLLDRTVPNRSCRTTPGGATDTAAGGAGILVNQLRNWTDGYSARFGTSWFVWRDFKETTSPIFEVFLGAGYDANVVPDKTIDVSLLDQNKVSISGGVRFEIWQRRVALAATYTQYVFMDRTVAPRPRDSLGAPIAPDFPSRSPDGAGTYSQSVGLLILTAQYRFW